MDASYASVEQLGLPYLRGKAIAVGGGGAHGAAIATSYEARQYGVHSAMSGILARKCCPHLIFVPPRFGRYKEVSRHIRSIFHRYTDLVEPLSLDKAYLDVTHSKVGNPSATLTVQEIRQTIFAETGFTASAGISISKFTAKIANDVNKPNGQKTVARDKVRDFLDALSVKKSYSTGKVTAEKVYALGIFTGRNLRQKSLTFLERDFGNSGEHYYQLAHGIHNDEVWPFRIRKSVEAEQTFTENLTSRIYMLRELDNIVSEVAIRLAQQKVVGKALTIKIKYSDFSIQTRSKTLKGYINPKEGIMLYIGELLYQDRLPGSVHLLGVSLSHLSNDPDKTVPPTPQYIQLKLQFPD